jgi:hypothetical protein
VLGLIKDYAVHWRPQFLVSAMSYFDVLNIGVEMTAPSCGANTVDFYASYITTMLLPAGAVCLCGGLWCAASAAALLAAARACAY